MSPERYPPLSSLHPDDSLLDIKLKQYSKLSDHELLESLLPSKPGSLKVRIDGTILDGHHRIKILRDRGIDVDRLPGEIIPKDVSVFEE